MAVLLFSGTSLFPKLIPLPVPTIIFGRSVVAAGAILLVLLFTGTPIRPRSRRDLAFLLGAGVLLAVHWVTYFQGIRVSTVAVGTIALHTYPIITVLTEPIIDRTRIKAADIVLAVVVLLGVVILVGRPTLSSTTTRGVLWGVLSAFLFTARNLLVRRSVRRYGSGTIMFFQTAVTALLLLPVPLFIAGGMAEAFSSWREFLLLGTIFTALSQTLYAGSLRSLSAKTVSIIATLLPLYAAITAALFLGEIPTVRTVLGGALVVGAVLVETVRATAGTPIREG
jgi:drug/metabolite transporter (DMT)-like permease